MPAHHHGISHRGLFEKFHVGGIMPGQPSAFADSAVLTTCDDADDCHSHCRLPIANCRLPVSSKANWQSEIDNWQCNPTGRNACPTPPLGPQSSRASDSQSDSSSRNASPADLPTLAGFFLDRLFRAQAVAMARAPTTLPPARGDSGKYENRQRCE